MFVPLNCEFGNKHQSIKINEIGDLLTPFQKKLGVKIRQNNAKYYIYMYNSSHGVKSSSCPTLEPVLFNSWYTQVTPEVIS